MTKSKPDGYWKKFSNLKKEIEKAIARAGRFPNTSELKEMRLSSLSAAITQHGGFIKVKRKLGIDHRTPNGYYDQFTNLRRDLETYMKTRRGFFPSYNQLAKEGRLDLYEGIKKQGGIEKVRNKFGQKSTVRPRSYWHDPATIRKEARAVIKKHKLQRLPHKGRLAELGYSSLGRSITSHYPGQYRGLRESLGETIEIRSHGYWGNPRTIEKEARTLILKKKLSRLPSSKELNELGFGALGAAISTRYPGGYTALRAKLGEEFIKKPAAYWKDVQNVKRELGPIIEKCGSFPSKQTLEKTGHGSLGLAIVKYHGGFRKFRDSMGFEQKCEKSGYWTPETTLARARDLYERCNGLPTQKTLTELGYSSLSVMASRHYGGLSNLRKMLDAEKGRNEENKLISLLQHYAGERQ